MQQGPECRVSGVVYIVVFSAIGLEQTILLEVLDLVPVLHRDLVQLVRLHSAKNCTDKRQSAEDLLEHLRVGVFADDDFLFGPNPVTAYFQL